MTRSQVLVLAAAAAVAVAGGIGLALRGPTEPPIPKEERSPILEEAKSEGVISGYRVILGPYGTWNYRVDGSGITLKFPNACGYRSCPQSEWVIMIDYPYSATRQARAILQITRRWAKHTFHTTLGYRIIFGPPYYP